MQWAAPNMVLPRIHFKLLIRLLVLTLWLLQNLLVRIYLAGMVKYSCISTDMLFLNEYTCVTTMPQTLMIDTKEPDQENTNSNA